MSNITESKSGNLPPAEAPKENLNFLVISAYNNDLSWVEGYKNDYVIYDKGGTTPISTSLLPKVIKSQNIGYNLYDMFSFIIDNYDKLPDVTTFCKGNIFPRHMSKSRFDELMNNQWFTPLFDVAMHRPQMPVCMFSSDGCWSEQNNGTTIINPAEKTIESKYFSTYNEMFKFIFVNPVLPRYITFVPGANYVVPKEYILKYSVNFYKNLRMFVSHCQLPTESHLIERALYSIWLGNFAVNPAMDVEIEEGASFRLTGQGLVMSSAGGAKTVARILEQSGARHGPPQSALENRRDNQAIGQRRGG